MLVPTLAGLQTNRGRPQDSSHGHLPFFRLFTVQISPRICSWFDRAEMALKSFFHWILFPFSFSPIWLHLHSLNTSLKHVLNTFWHHSRATIVMSWNCQKVQQQFSEMISPPKSLLSRFPPTRQSKFHFNALIIICNLSGAARDKQDMILDTDDTDR